jgi:hypothetical protein
MTRKLTRKTTSFRRIAPFIAVLTILAALVALAQVTGTGQSSGQSAGAGARFQVRRSAARPTQPFSPLFLPAVIYSSGGGQAFSVAVGDLNGDGKPDVVVVNDCFCDLGVAVLLGNGDGTFQTAVTYPSGGALAVSVVIADVNGDGKPDLVVGNDCGTFSNNTCSGTAESGIGVLLGNGDGTFQGPAAYLSGGTFLQSVAVADVNGDGRLDLLAVNACAFVNARNCSGTLRNGNVAVLMNSGFGTFYRPNTFNSGGISPTSVAVVDLRGNGSHDLAVANFNSGTVGVLLQNGNGFRTAVTYSAQGGAVSWVVAADVNGDGKADLVVADGSGVGVLLGNGDGTLQPIVTYSSGGSQATSIAVADVNGDGKPDLILANSGSGTVGALLGNGDGTFQKALTYHSGGGAYSVAIADVNGDAKPDLLVANFDSATVGVLLNNSGIHSPTSTSLTSSLNPSNYGQKVTWTATVTTSGPITPTGKVNFTWGNSIGIVALNANGVATLSRSNVNADTYPLKAVYVGDADNLGSTSSVVSQVIEQATSSAALTSSPNPSTLGQGVTFTATITSSTAIGKSPVTFNAGQTVLGTAQLSSGKARLTISSLPLGPTNIIVTYSGSSNIGGSKASLIQRVNR